MYAPMLADTFSYRLKLGKEGECGASFYGDLAARIVSLASTLFSLAITKGS